MRGQQTPYSKAVQFFYRQAGYSYDPKTETKRRGRLRGARALAKAEGEARNKGIEFSWVPDECIGCDCGSTDCSCYTGSSHESVACLAQTDNMVWASLGGICGASSEYRRVVEAELALEAIGELEGQEVEG